MNIQHWDGIWTDVMFAVMCTKLNSAKPFAGDCNQTLSNSS